MTNVLRNVLFPVMMHTNHKMSMLASGQCTGRETKPKSPVGNHISNFSTNVLFNKSSQARDAAPKSPNGEHNGFTLPIDQF